MHGMSSAPPPAPVLTRHLLRARDLADARFDASLDVPQMARRAHVSTAHFSRCFKETFGETPHQYLLTRRLQRAQELLRLTDLSVGEVCIAVGYASTASFSATFKRIVGMSPSAWRTHAREQDTLARLPSCITRAWLRPQPGDRAEMDKRAG
jgi:transcriptional regulator GlxA family with amidase domain